MDKDEWTEYKAIEADAQRHESRARVENDPRHAQVLATLAVSARLEALCYALRHMLDPGDLV